MHILRTTKNRLFPFRVHLIRIEIVFHCTFVLQKYKTRNVNPETMYFCFRVLYFQKYKKTLTFSVLGAPGVYFLYFLSYSWGVSVEWFLVSVLYCWFVCHHTAALVGVRQQKLSIVSGWKRLVDIFVWDIAIVYTLHLCHFCWCFCCRPLIDRHRVVALYSFNQKLVWV